MKNLFCVLTRILCVWTWPAAYRAYIDEITTSGYIGKPSRFVQLFTNLFFRFFGFILIGRVKVVGEENLRARGRLIFCPNHSTLLDAVVMYPLMRNRLVRAIGARETLREVFGLTGVLLTKVGVIPVDRSRGRTVIKPAIDVLEAGDCLAMFPEGKISPSGELLPFKLGAAWITRSVYEKLGEPGQVGIVPIHIRYHKRDTATACNFFKMGLRWRGGVTVTVGKPIWLHDHPTKTPEELMAMVRAHIELHNTQPAF